MISVKRVNKGHTKLDKLAWDRLSSHAGDWRFAYQD
jgi:hypothetical protein